MKKDCITHTLTAVDKQENNKTTGEVLKRNEGVV